MSNMLEEIDTQMGTSLNYSVANFKASDPNNRDSLKDNVLDAIKNLGTLETKLHELQTSIGLTGNFNAVTGDIANQANAMKTRITNIKTKIKDIKGLIDNTQYQLLNGTWNRNGTDAFSFTNLAHLQILIDRLAQAKTDRCSSYSRMGGNKPMP